MKPRLGRPDGPRERTRRRLETLRLRCPRPRSLPHAEVTERHYKGAALAAASAADPVVTANVLAFWAMARYSDGDTSGALAYADAALHSAQRTGSARLTALAYARAGRAHARAGDLRASRQAAQVAW